MFICTATNCEKWKNRHIWEEDCMERLQINITLKHTRKLKPHSKLHLKYSRQHTTHKSACHSCQPIRNTTTMSTAQALSHIPAHRPTAASYSNEMLIPGSPCVRATDSVHSGLSSTQTGSTGQLEANWRSPQVSGLWGTGWSGNATGREKCPMLKIEVHTSNDWNT